MFAQDVSSELAATIESCEVNAWRDMYAAAPTAFIRRFQLEIVQIQNIVLTCCPTIPFVHFNCVKNLGMMEPATEALIDEILAIYQGAGVRHCTFYHIPHSQPAHLTEWFAARGLRPNGGWDRIYRDSSPLVGPVVAPQKGMAVEKVTLATAPEWATYIDTIYGLPTTPWLLALVDRPGWHHYMLRQDGQIAAVRTMYIGAGGLAWLGIDAPVPGLMATSYDLDMQICQTMVQDGLAAGARCFVADIEAPDPQMDTPAYRNFEALGFRRPYMRLHYGLS